MFTVAASINVAVLSQEIPGPAALPRARENVSVRSAWVLAWFRATLEDVIAAHWWHVVSIRYGWPLMHKMAFSSKFAHS